MNNTNSTNHPTDPLKQDAQPPFDSKVDNRLPFHTPETDEDLSPYFFRMSGAQIAQMLKDLFREIEHHSRASIQFRPWTTESVTVPAPDMTSMSSAVHGLLVSAFHAMWKRSQGDYLTDEFGFDEQIFAFIKPVMQFFYSHYWRVKAEGLEHIPETGPALIVCNHAGFMPWDSEMIRWSIVKKQDSLSSWIMHSAMIPRLPFVSAFSLKIGRMLQCEVNIRKLLEKQRLVVCYPEGDKGLWKRYQKRYQILPFTEMYIFQLALELRVPIIPCVIVGPQESYPLLTAYHIPGKPLGIPYLPITPLFPGLPFPFCFIAFPGDWQIRFLPPIKLYEITQEEAEIMLFHETELCEQSLRRGVLDLLRARNSPIDRG